MSECPQYIIPPKTLDMEHKLSACNYFLFFLHPFTELFQKTLV